MATPSLDTHSLHGKLLQKKKTYSEMSKRNGSTIILRKPLSAYLLLSKEPEMIWSYYLSYLYVHNVYILYHFVYDNHASFTKYLLSTVYSISSLRSLMYCETKKKETIFCCSLWSVLTRLYKSISRGCKIFNCFTELWYSSVTQYSWNKLQV